MEDHTPITFDSFNGLYVRGRNESVLRDHSSICTNIEFYDKEIQTRFGSNLNFDDITNIKRIRLYKREGEATRVLILDSSGNIYDSTNVASPILTVVGMTDFKMEVFFSRAYITPIDSANEIGVSGSFLYVYDGTGVARKAAGTIPVGTLTATESAISGNVEAGYHLYAVAFETASGFITKPGPAIYAILESSGGFKVSLSGIPTGPSGTTKRHILATRSILVYDGNQEGYEFFFVANATINDNTTTTTTLSFFDADLISSAEYLFDQYQEIFAGIDLFEYKGRLCIANGNYIYLSRVGEPESFDALTGLALVGPGESSNIVACIEHREILYIHKKHRSFVTADNGNDPSTWIIPPIDKGTGSFIHGIIRILDAEGVSTDKFLVCAPKGLLIFNGYYQEPELTWKVENIWKRINRNYFNLVHGINDTDNHKVYIALPLDAATSCSHILVGNYKNGLDYLSIRWSLWNSAAWNPTSILIDLANDIPYLRIASSTGIFDISSSSRLDEGQAIISVNKTAPVDLRPGYLHHFGSVRMSVRGSGTLACALLSKDDVATSNLANTTLSLSPGKDYTRLTNFTNEKCAVSLTTSGAGDWFSLSRLDLYSKIVSAARPN